MIGWYRTVLKSHLTLKSGTLPKPTLFFLVMRSFQMGSLSPCCQQTLVRPIPLAFVPFRNTWILVWFKLSCQSEASVIYSLYFFFKKKNIQEVIKSGFHKGKKWALSFLNKTYLIKVETADTFKASEGNAKIMAQFHFLCAPCLFSLWCYSIRHLIFPS